VAQTTRSHQYTEIEQTNLTTHTATKTMNARFGYAISSSLLTSHVTRSGTADFSVVNYREMLTRLRFDRKLTVQIA